MMSQLLLLTLASAITLGALILIVLGVCLMTRLVPARRRLLAIISLLIYGSVIILRPSGWLLINLAVLIGALGAAVLISDSLRSTGAVVAFLVAAAAVDLFSVSGGLSRAIIDQYQAGTSNLLLYLALVLPVGGRFVPIVGISDLLVGSSAAAALHRLELKPLPVIGTIAIGLLCALIYGVWRGGAPALPFLAISAIVLIWRNSIISARQTDGESTL